VLGLALVVLDESLEVLLEVLVVVALHIQAKNLVVLGVHMVYFDHAASPYSSISMRRWCRQIRRWHPMLRLLLDCFGLFALRLFFILLGLLSF